MKANHFELPANLTTKKLISALNERFATHLISQQYSLKTYYDSFDWRLFKQDLICELNRSKQSSSLILSNRKTGELVASTMLFDVPSFSKQFNPGKVRQILEPVLGVRALLAICTLECDTYHLDITDKDENTLLRLLLEEFELLPSRLTLFPVKDNHKFAKQVAKIFMDDFAMTTENKPFLLKALSLQGRKPKDYSTKHEPCLNPKMPADVASKLIFQSLLKTIKLNEQGVINDTDSEFLHDFRVAVRKTRVGLSYMKNILPPEILASNKQFFSWLGQITNECRDLDVYLLNFADYKKKLPVSIRQNINPLQVFLAEKKKRAHKQLANKLRSKKYLTALATWEEYLGTGTQYKGIKSTVDLPTKRLADKKIWKTYRKIIKLGDEIGEDSPPGNLHELRKSCKKLRYLMEFFQSLYPEKQIDKLITSLKKLQDVLGSFQDYAVQQQQLQQFSSEMQSAKMPSQTFLALGVLIQDFDKRKCKARNGFAAQYSAFKKPKIKATFRALFSDGKTRI